MNFNKVNLINFSYLLKLIVFLFLLNGKKLNLY
jgi:hypothetical protein